jgi:hypothetical protein
LQKLQLSSPSLPPGAKREIYKSNMLKKIISLLVLASFTGIVALKAEPTPTPAPSNHRKSSKKIKKEARPKLVPAAPLPEGWSLVNGVWMHSDGYKFINGQVIRTGTQTHKRPPKPPTQAQVDAVTKKKRGPLTPAEIAAEKAAERERNLRPRPAPQTGTNL